MHGMVMIRVYVDVPIWAGLSVEGVFYWHLDENVEVYSINVFV